MDAEDTPIFLPQLCGGELKMLTVIYKCTWYVSESSKSKNRWTDSYTSNQ